MLIQRSSSTYARTWRNARDLRLCRLVALKAGEGETFDEPISPNEIGNSSIVYSQQNSDVSDKLEFPLTVPLLPFAVEEVMLPGSVKTLHLFEARYLSLLEEVLASPNSNKLLGHVVIEQPYDAVGNKASAYPGAYVGDSFILLMGTIVRVLEVKSLQIGALVKIQAECRMQVTRISQVQPFIRGTVIPLQDQPLQDEQQVQQQVQQLVSTMQDLQNLTLKFRSKQTAALQQAMYWWEKPVLIPAAAAFVEPPDRKGTTWLISGLDVEMEACSSSSNSSLGASKQNKDSAAGAEAGAGAAGAAAAGESSGSQEAGLAERAARLSFAALQCVPEASPKEQLKLLRCCVNANETSDTSKRMKMVQDHMQETFKLLAAKCALKSLQLG